MACLLLIRWKYFHEKYDKYFFLHQRNYYCFVHLCTHLKHMCYSWCTFMRMFPHTGTYFHSAGNFPPFPVYIHKHRQVKPKIVIVRTELKVERERDGGHLFHAFTSNYISENFSKINFKNTGNFCRLLNMSE